MPLAGIDPGYRDLVYLVSNLSVDQLDKIKWSKYLKRHVRPVPQISAPNLNAKLEKRKKSRYILKLFFFN